MNRIPYLAASSSSKLVKLTVLHWSDSGRRGGNSNDLPSSELLSVWSSTSGGDVVAIFLIAVVVVVIAVVVAAVAVVVVVVVVA